MGDGVDRPHIGGKPAPDRVQRLVGRLVAIATIELAEIFEPDHQHRESVFARARRREPRFERTIEGAAIRPAADRKQRCVVLSQNAHQAVRAHGTAARIGVAAAEILDRMRDAVGPLEMIERAIGRAFASVLGYVLARGVLDRVKARRGEFRAHQFGVAGPGRQRCQ